MNGAHLAGIFTTVDALRRAESCIAGTGVQPVVRGYRRLSPLSPATASLPCTAACRSAPVRRATSAALDAPPSTAFCATKAWTAIYDLRGSRGVPVAERARAAATPSGSRRSKSASARRGDHARVTSTCRGSTASAACGSSRSSSGARAGGERVIVNPSLGRVDMVVRPDFDVRAFVAARRALRIPLRVRPSSARRARRATCSGVSGSAPRSR